MPDYTKMIEEIAEMVDEGVSTTDALEKVKKKYSLSDKECECLLDRYTEYCREEEEDIDSFI